MVFLLAMYEEIKTSHTNWIRYTSRLYKKDSVLGIGNSLAGFETSLSGIFFI